MLEIDGKQYRNLEEQVLKNKQDIANHYAVDRALSNFGIKIVGRANTVEELPVADTYAGNYGDAYAVGTSAPFTFYIFTRPDPNAGEPNNYWLDVGQLSIVGPQGIPGPQGPQGPAGTSNKWYTETLPSNPKVGDMALLANGNVYQYQSNGQWQLIQNIMGPQGTIGPRGPQGIPGPQGLTGQQGQRGDTGGLVNIAGILSNESQLPTPEELNNPTIAYLVGASAPYNLYIQIGETPATALWTNVGPLNVATMVTVGGEYQNTWSADSKLDRKQAPNQYTPYVYAENGGQTQLIKVDIDAYGDIVRYYTNALGITPSGYLRSAMPSQNDMAQDGYLVITSANLQQWGLLDNNGNFTGGSVANSVNHNITITNQTDGWNISFNVINHDKNNYTYMAGSLPPNYTSIIPKGAQAFYQIASGGPLRNCRIKSTTANTITITEFDGTDVLLKLLFPTTATDVTTDMGIDPLLP